ncbi:nitroreductase family protein [Anaerosinus massiliensis]|uniref:nitroreductase family protein n=1 Tax=Massilibacillus massiliensis TaxID=1806837 RepID=UPI000A4BC309|nr:nitroreductase family protein [Massilibacillus massiliensis]
MSLITVNKRCIKCGLCIEECPVDVLKMGEKGPEEVADSNCIACGHCVAICPKTAIDNKKTPLAQQVDMKDFPKLNPQQAEHFLRSRRSIRNYHDKPVPRELLSKLVNIARLAPTASNSQGISYVIIENKQLLEKSVELTIQMIEKSPVRHLLEVAITGYRERGIDSVFRGAPNLIIAIADKNLLYAKNNAISCLTYLELFAPSLGLGTCWAGIFEHFAAIENSPLTNLFNIPEEKIVVGAVMVGYPKYKYRRLVDRNSLDVTYIN